MKKIILTAAAALALTVGQNASADVDVGISIGIPGFVYPAPGYYYAPPPPPRHIHRPQVVVVPQPVYVPGSRWVWSGDKRGHYRAVPPGHRGDKHWRKHHRGHGGWGRD